MSARNPTRGSDQVWNATHSATVAMPEVIVRRWTLWPFRVVVTAMSIQVLAQAALAGGFLSGHYGSLHAHEINGLALAGAGWLLPVTGVLLWRPGRFSPWPILAGLLAYVAILAQLALGFTRALVVHIPLGVLLLVALAFLTRWAWWPAPPEPAANRTGIPTGRPRP